MVNRRTFLRGVLSVTATALVPLPVLKLLGPLSGVNSVGANTVGAFPIRQDITVLPADDPRKLKLGWIIYEEEVGIVVVNDYSINRIEVGHPRERVIDGRVFRDVVAA